MAFKLFFLSQRILRVRRTRVRHNHILKSDDFQFTWFLEGNILMSALDILKINKMLKMYLFAILTNCCVVMK